MHFPTTIRAKNSYLFKSPIISARDFDIVDDKRSRVIIILKQQQ